MKLDSTPLAIMAAGIFVSGAILLNGYFDRAAKELRTPSKAEVQKAIVAACPLYVVPAKNVYGSPAKGTEVTAIEVIKLTPSLDASKVLVELRYDTVSGKSAKTQVVLERDPFGEYRGIWQHDDTRTHLAIAQ